MGDNTRRVSAFNQDNMDAAAADWLVAVLDKQGDADGVRRLRQWSHEALAARPGERAVDVGSGTGSEIIVLGAAVGPDGEAIGVEPNPALREVAEERAGNLARFVDGQAQALPFEDASVDIVWCERVFQHLSDPEAAAAEIARVLRPGGRVALIDTDWGTSITYPGDPKVVEALTQASLTASVNPFSGRRLIGQLAAVGLELDDVGSQALIQDPRQVNWPLIRVLTEGGVVQGMLTPELRDQFHADLTAAAEQGSMHMSVTMFSVIAHRPA